MNGKIDEIELIKRFVEKHSKLGVIDPETITFNEPLGCSQVFTDKGFRVDVSGTHIWVLKDGQPERDFRGNGGGAIRPDCELHPDFEKLYGNTKL